MKELEYTSYKDIPYVTEAAVKHATMPFLKSYYRYRSNLMNSELETGDFAKAEFDLRTEAGVEIDGLLTYKQRGGNDFIVSFEASSQQSKDEVIYSVQDALLFWDGFAICSILSTIILSSFYVFGAIDIRYWGLPYMVFGLFMLTMFLTLIYMSIFRYILTYVDRYHYIYAVEQFKKYHADEQWISFSYDIFNGPEDPYLEELKDQCITNGFGLIEIQENLTPILIITPAREGVFGSTRSLAEYIPVADFSRRLMDNRYAKMLKKQFKRSRDMYLNLSRSRYERNYRLQVGVVAMACLLMGGILWEELHEPDILFYDEADLAALQERDFEAESAAEKNPIDSIDRLNIQPFQDVRESYLDDDHDQPLFTLRDKEKPKNLVDTDDGFVAEPILKEVKEVEKNAPEIGLYLFDKGEVLGEYPCERIAHRHHIKYAVEESIYATKQAALKRVDRLAKNGVSTNILSIHCFDTTNDSFMVFFEVLFDSLNVAEMHLLLAEQKMKRATSEASPQLSVRRLERDSL